MKQQILFVTGKGGVGKTSISIMLGLASAQKGLRTLIVQTYGARCVAPFFNKPKASYTPNRLLSNLYTLTITAEEAIEEYALQQLKFRRLYSLIFENRFAKPLINGAPGLHDAVHLGKIYDLAEREKWECIIVDAPATGHALSMLRSARTMMDLTKVGPMYNSNRIVDEVFSDPLRTGVILVSLLEQLPVQESIDLWNGLGHDFQNQCLSLICNRVISSPPEEPNPLSDDWLKVSTHLTKQYTLQQDLCSTLEKIPRTQYHVPVLPHKDKDAWTEQGLKLWL